jgi:hypothetical protein
MIGSDQIFKSHWAKDIIGKEKGGFSEVGLHDIELDNFLIAANYATFGFFRTKKVDEIYFIMLTPHLGLTMTLI